MSKNNLLVMEKIININSQSGGGGLYFKITTGNSPKTTQGIGGYISNLKPIFTAHTKIRTLVVKSNTSRHSQGDVGYMWGVCFKF